MFDCDLAMVFVVVIIIISFLIEFGILIELDHPKTRFLKDIQLLHLKNPKNLININKLISINFIKWVNSNLLLLITYFDSIIVV